MTDFPASYPPDEPVIGATTPPPPPPPRLPSSPFAPRQQSWNDTEAYGYDEADAYDDAYDEADGYGYGYEYDERPPVRQPVFYVFLGLAGLVGAAAIFLLVMVFREGDTTTPDDTSPAQPGAAQVAFNVALTAPRQGDRLPTGSSQDVHVSATSTERIVRFELFVNDQLADQVPAGEPDAQQVYSGTLRARFERRGDYTMYVRVVSVNGGSKKTGSVKITAVEDVGSRPKEIRGKVIAATTLRNGPGESYAEAGTVNPPLDVVVTGKNADGSWLQLSLDGGKWVKAAAVDVPDIALVQVAQPTGPPTPLPVIATATQAPSPTVSGTATPSATATQGPAPDFVPTNVVVSSGGMRLRVTVTNIAPTPYSGQLVVSVSGDVLTDTRAFGVNVAGNGGRAELDFDLSQPVTQPGKRAVITVNPEKNPREMNYDNNSATFVLAVQVEAPAIALGATAGPNQVTVTISNNGGPLAAAGARLTVNIETVDGSSRTDKTVDLNLVKGTPQIVIIQRPQGNGQGKVELIVNGQTIASTTVALNP